MKTHLAYLSVIAILVLGFVFREDVPKIEMSIDGDYVLVPAVPELFYATVSPNDTEVQIHKGYRPNVEYRAMNGVTYPFVAGTDKILVAINTKSGSYHQWIWNASIDNELPADHSLITLPKLELLPEAYRPAIVAFNGAHPDGKLKIGRATVKGLFPDDQITRVPVTLGSGR